jgi:hypothetical protein
MNTLKKIILPILVATVWISISEFARNEFILKTYWTEHYASLGLVFPSAPVNGAIWGIWSLAYAVSIFIVSRKFSLIQTTLLSWLTGFVMMWLVIGNLGVLPFGILSFGIPLSMLEAYIASYIIFKVTYFREKAKDGMI